MAAILSAAERLFLGRNYSDVTMDQVAARSGVTKGALYHHFASKEELYLEMMSKALGRLAALFSRALDTEGGCRERLRELTRAFFALPPDQIGLMRLVRRDANVFGPAGRAALVRSYQEALPSRVEAVVGEGLRTGELAPGDPRLLAWHFIATVEVTLGRRAGSVLPGPGAKLDHVLDLFFLGAAARPPASPGAARRELRREVCP